MGAWRALLISQRGPMGTHREALSPVCGTGWIRPSCLLATAPQGKARYNSPTMQHPKCAVISFAIAAALMGAALSQETPKAVSVISQIGGDKAVTIEIEEGELRDHVKALSHDLLAGRSMGSEESMVAARYCEQQLKAMGLGPGALDSSFFQMIPFGSTTYVAPPELRVVTTDGESHELFYGEHFTFQTASLAENTIEMDCVLVAEQGDIPEVADPSKALVMTTSASKAAKWLREAGFPRGRGFGMVVIPRKRGGGERSVPRPTRMRPVDSSVGGLNVSVFGDLVEKARAGEFAKVRFEAHATHERRNDANVAAVLPGAGELAKEFVILSAHRDHIGLSRVPEGARESADAINNGADDDASGCATVMEIAEALALGAKVSGDAPRRSVLVLLVTGEEAGLIGSNFWAENPTTPIKDIVCALNFEMLGRPDDLVGGKGKLWLTGDGRSDLGPYLRKMGLGIVADQRLEMQFFKRSDNVSFAKVGIVAQTLSTFGMHADYHKVSDEWDTLDYPHMTAAANDCLKAVQAMVNSDWKPSWNEGEPKL